MLEATVQVLAAGQSGHGAFVDPAMPAQAGGDLFATAGNAGYETAFAEPSPLVIVVVAHFTRRFVWPATP
ncbi:hypothetical protein OKW18_000860 [Streptomyces pratensis]|nr:hypothetical protein [Streptomyces pratensis]